MFAIRARRLFDGVDMHENKVVVVDGWRIADVTDDAPDALDLGDDVTLLPGLIDCHVHLAFDASLDPIGHLEEPGLADRMREAATRHLHAGVTTVRDLGDRDYLALELGLDVTEGPEIIGAGPPITTPKGHCWFLGGEAEGEQGVRAAVRERAERGARVVKMMVTGGEMTPGSEPYLLQYGMAELKAAADEAHELGLPIAGHAHAPEGIVYALEAGFDTIEHCAFWTEDSIEPDAGIIARLAASDVIVSLTAGIVPVRNLTPPPNLAKRMPLLMETLRQLYRGGVKFVIGSDAGIAPVKPHGLLPFGAKMLVDLGFEPVDVLRSITSRAAQACRVGDAKGRLAPGFDADLVAVQGDPLADVTALQVPVAIYRLGRKVPLPG
ncbi:amidohydrolase family protein [Nonomuraea sediminis]|uniref:amidohydrolase family protein n=1 Tax=Nonomuraea sediminis TaxID=2835864 RepID=UPI001BDC6982|nr:amidohydrolase family protein [Nonomuraea sediminis]